MKNYSKSNIAQQNPTFSNMLQHNFIKKEVQADTIADVKVDASFRKIAKNAIYFHIWKIDEDRLEAVPKSQYSTFYDDAAYIIYAAGPTGHYVNQDTIMRETKLGLHLDRYIHFWLGEKVSEQKRSNVAHKIQELDSYFGNVATEYRETQDHESTRFLSYFKRGITIRSGVLTLSPDPNRLYQLRGRKCLRCIEMQEISWDYFASQYIMLLQTSTQLFLWIGRSSSSIERRDAMELALRWQNTLKNITAVIVLDDGYEQLMPEHYKRTWNTHLPLNKRIVSQNVCDVNEAVHISKIKIYKCGYRTNRLHLDQLDVIMPTRDDLSDSTAVYVLDTYTQGIWLWVGKDVKRQESIGSMGNGRAFVKKKKYPYSTPVIRVVEGQEPLEFQRMFASWNSDWCDSPVKQTVNKWAYCDSITLCQRPKMAASTQLVDDGSGERTIYQITKDQIIEMPPTKIIMFTTKSSYVIRYTVVQPPPNLADPEGVGIQIIIYQWTGSEVSEELMKISERYAKNAFETATSKAMFVQMNEGDETPHFLQIFNGKFIITLNDKSSGSNGCQKQQTTSLNGKESSSNVNENESTDDNFIFKIHGDATYNSKAIEVFPITAMSSKECYVVKTGHVWVWCGKTSTGDRREVAKKYGALLGESSLVLEGKEPTEFWSSVANQVNKSATAITNGCGGSCSSNSSCGSSTTGNGNGRGSPMNGNIGYLNILTPNGSITTSARPQAQLFLIWPSQASFCCREIFAFEQNDLSPECTYILDAGEIIYIWLGQYTTKQEQQSYLKMVMFYTDTVVPIARRPTTAITVIRQNNEPNVFKGFFETWDHKLWENYQTYEQKRQAPKSSDRQNGDEEHGQTPTLKNGSLSNGNLLTNPIQPHAFLNRQKEFDRHHKYPVATLQLENDLLPPGVNPLNREVHLTHDDFVLVFNMSFWEFDDLPAWRKQELKKKHKLF